MARNYLNPLSELHDEIDRIFTDFTEDTRRPAKSETSGKSRWLPPVEVSETASDVVVNVALPGIRPEDINVEIVGNALILSGESRREERKEEKHFHRSEFYYGSFMRRVTLPEYIQGEAAVAEFKNGVLELRIPKLEEGRRKRIPVKVQ